MFNVRSIPFKTRKTRQGFLLLPLPSNPVLEVRAGAMQKDKEKKKKGNETEETELSVFIDPLIILRKPERFYKQTKINK